MYPWTDCFEGYRRCRLRADLHSDTVAFQSEAVGQVLNGLNVGYVYGHFVALVHFKLRDAECRRNGCHVHAYFVAFAYDFSGFFQLNAVFLRLFQSIFPEPWVFTVPSFAWVHFGSGNQTEVMWFCKSRVIVNQTHFIAGDVDQLVTLRFQRTCVQEAVFGEFIQRHQPFTVGFFSFAHGSVVVARLIVNVQFLFNRINFLAFVGFNRIVDIPFHHLAVDKQCCISIAATVKCSV